jgi:SAM-dependent methyltransferase
MSAIPCPSDFVVRPKALPLDRPTDGRVPGSFRDPGGFVFRRDRRVYRALTAGQHDTLRQLSGGLLAELLADGSLVGTRFVDSPAERDCLAEEHAGAAHFLEHDEVAPITYPCEWTVSMLSDAAFLTLDLHLRLLETGHGLKDASAYNVQFVAGRPLFIDLASIERVQRLDVWPALDQFQRMFTLPLLLCRHHGWDPRSCFLPVPQGRTVEEAARIVGRLRMSHPRYWLDLTIPWLLSGPAERLFDKSTAAEAIATRSADAQIWNLRRLRRKIARLADGYRARGAWTAYTRHCGYDELAGRFKRDFVADVLAKIRPRCVLDLGCNTGAYSRLAANHAQSVVAVDGDHDAVEMLYRDLRSRPARITPLVCDLLSPTPAFGFRNAERPALPERLSADCVLALALMHHLLVRGNLPLESLCDQLHELTSSDLLIEFVPPTDPMFRRLARGRQELFAALDSDRFRGVFGRRFHILREVPIPHSCRTIAWMRRKDAHDARS